MCGRGGGGANAEGLKVWRRGGWPKKKNQRGLKVCWSRESGVWSQEWAA